MKLELSSPCSQEPI